MRVFVTAIFAILVLNTPALAGGDTHWTYEGASGAEHWGSLAPQFAACDQGRSQSPIDLRWKPVREKRTIEFLYAQSKVTVVDNGHTVQVNVAPGNEVVIDGAHYELLQFHFHAESEHTISGKHFPLEMHFVHKNSQGELAVVGVMFQAGRSNPIIETVWQNIPKSRAVESEVDKKIDLLSLLPAKFTHYHYSGSLTTPPCTENVNWNVMNTPVEVSPAQIKAFQGMYSHNNRPVQPLNGRTLTNY